MNPTLRRLALVATTSVFLAAGGYLLAAHGPPGGAPLVEKPVGPFTIAPPLGLTDFQLTDRSGRLVTGADLDGRWVVVHLLYTGCKTGCGLIGERVAELQGLVARWPDVQLLSITVDPRTDTPPVLKKYADALHADPNRWLLLTGKKAEIYRVIESSFLPRPPGPPPTIPELPDTDKLFLVDPSGLTRTFFDGQNRKVAAVIAAEIERRKREGT